MAADSKNNKIGELKKSDLGNTQDRVENASRVSANMPISTDSPMLRAHLEPRESGVDPSITFSGALRIDANISSYPSERDSISTQIEIDAKNGSRIQGDGAINNNEQPDLNQKTHNEKTRLLPFNVRDFLNSEGIIREDKVNVARRAAVSVMCCG